jgi:hypothetical protein
MVGMTTDIKGSDGLMCTVLASNTVWTGSKCDPGQKEGGVAAGPPSCCCTVGRTT